MRFCKKCNTETNRNVKGDCKPCATLRAKLWVLKNKERCAKTRALHHAANKERFNAISRERYKSKQLEVALYRKNNKEKIAAYDAMWREINKEKRKKDIFLWKLKNPDADRIYCQNRRARKLSNGGILSKGLFDKLFKLQRGKCPVCKAALSNTKPRSPMDHIIALVNGGTNEDCNIQLLCQPCNNQKHVKDPIVFMQSKGFLL